MVDLSFGRWLQRRREALDMTQVMLGQRVGYAAGTIHKIETDQLRPSRQMAQKLAAELEIDPPNGRLSYGSRETTPGRTRPCFCPSSPERPAVHPGVAARNDLPVAPTRVLGEKRR